MMDGAMVVPVCSFDPKQSQMSTDWKKTLLS
jgi:hypothetical protein